MRPPPVTSTCHCSRSLAIAMRESTLDIIAEYIDT